MAVLRVECGGFHVFLLRVTAVPRFHFPLAFETLGHPTLFFRPPAPARSKRACRHSENVIFMIRLFSVENKNAHMCQKWLHILIPLEKCYLTHRRFLKNVFENRQFFDFFRFSKNPYFKTKCLVVFLVASPKDDQPFWLCPLRSLVSATTQRKSLQSLASVRVVFGVCPRRCAVQLCVVPRSPLVWRGRLLRVQLLLLFCGVCLQPYTPSPPVKKPQICSRLWPFPYKETPPNHIDLYGKSMVGSKTIWIHMGSWGLHVISRCFLSGGNGGVYFLTVNAGLRGGVPQMRALSDAMRLVQPWAIASW